MAASKPHYFLRNKKIQYGTMEKACNSFNGTNSKKLNNFIWILGFAAACADRQLCSPICSENTCSKDITILVWLITIFITNNMFSNKIMI